jgi:hypothetical protein
VPPKAILRKPFPQLITVPACHDCNSKWGNVDERFRNVLSLILGEFTPQAKEFWETRVAAGVRQGGPATKIIGEVRANRFAIDARDIDPMMVRLVKGLLYATLRIPLPTYVAVEAHVLLNDGGPKALAVFTEIGFKYRQVGPDFEVWYGFSDKGFASWWLFRFFGTVYALGVTGTAAEETLATKPSQRVEAFIAKGKLHKL